MNSKLAGCLIFAIGLVGAVSEANAGCVTQRQGIRSTTNCDGVITERYGNRSKTYGLDGTVTERHGTRSTTYGDGTVTNRYGTRSTTYGDGSTTYSDGDRSVTYQRRRRDWYED